MKFGFSKRHSQSEPWEPDTPKLRCPGCGLVWKYHLGQPSCPECGCTDRATVVEPAKSTDWSQFERSSSLPVGPLRVRFLVMKRDGYCCQLCGRSAQDGVKLEVDHRIAKANGGSNDMDNQWTLCFDCNRGKGTDEL